jgi:hypothetical protein
MGLGHPPCHIAFSLFPFPAAIVFPIHADSLGFQFEFDSVAGFIVHAIIWSKKTCDFCWSSFGWVSGHTVITIWMGLLSHLGLVVHIISNIRHAFDLLHRFDFRCWQS